MKIESFEIPDLKLITPVVHRDTRGYFMESFNQKEIGTHINIRNFVQDNETYSVFGVLRGLHFQNPPHSQSKLMRVIEGEVFDVVVDLRSDSPTYGKHVALKINGKQKQMLYVPRGFAHGFLVLSENAVISYKVDAYYHPESERTLDWKDKTLNIKWPLSESEIFLSEKDKNGTPWRKLPQFDQKQWES
ncbi:MAG: dTDP-4-dehydrorhamnose 3,5-epimerase [SAR324 cluster bacterium]|nr:dTDP-4-dehydrorhamnose 3,5-epimerase [SAR324 cluster bacterium]